MRASTLIQTISFKFSSRVTSPTSSVAPWPLLRSPVDQWLVTELDNLWISPFGHGRYTSATWLSKALDLAVSSQKIMMKYVGASARSTLSSSDRKLVDDYLEDIVELLDACNGIREKMENVINYINLMLNALHSLEGEGELHEAIVGRAKAALASCEAMEKRYGELDKCGSNLRKLGEKLASSSNAMQVVSSDVEPSSELMEAMSSSRAVALLVVAMLNIALSFKTKRGLPVAQANKASLHKLHREVKEEFDKRRKDGLVVMDELEAMVCLSRRVREKLSQARRDGRTVDMKDLVEEGKRRCGELEERVRGCGEKVDELYRELIGIRVSMLGMVSY